MLVVEGDDSVRSHSVQGIGFGAAAIGVSIAVGIRLGVLTAIPVAGDISRLSVFPATGLVGLASPGVWVLLVSEACEGERYGLPVLGPTVVSN